MYLVIECIEAVYIHLDRVYDVVRSRKQHIQEMFVPHFFLIEVFSMPFASLMNSFEFLGAHRLYIFALNPTNSLGGILPASLLNFQRIRLFACDYDYY